VASHPLRRIFAGDEHGTVHLINFINGVIIARISLHSKEVTNVIYCGKTGFLISTGSDGKVCMVYEVRGNS